VNEDNIAESCRKIIAYLQNNLYFPDPFRQRSLTTVTENHAELSDICEQSSQQSDGLMIVRTQAANNARVYDKENPIYSEIG